MQTLVRKSLTSHSWGDRIESTKHMFDTLQEVVTCTAAVQKPVSA
jgi:hypothetical protein